MNIEAYIAKHPEANFPDLHKWWPGIMATGMLEFTPGTAHMWSGPFVGNAALYRLIDNREGPFADPGPDWAVAQEKALMRLKAGWKPYGYDREAMIAAVTAGDTDAIHMVTGWGTNSHLFRVVVCGNDDKTWSKWMKTEQEARDFIHLLEGVGPLDFEKDFLPLGWTFTN